MNQELFEKIRTEFEREIEGNCITLSMGPYLMEVCDRYSKAYAKECIKASIKRMKSKMYNEGGTDVHEQFSIDDPENIVLL